MPTPLPMPLIRCLPLLIPLPLPLRLPLLPLSCFAPASASPFSCQSTASALATPPQVGQQRTVRTGGRRVVNFLWIEAAHWGKVVANNTLGLEGASSETSATFVFSRRGTLIATSCRTDDLDHTLLNASDSTCAIVRQTYEWLRNAGHEDHRGYRGRGELELGSYFICMRQLVTSTGEATPYFIVSSYPLSSVERPVQVCGCSEGMLATVAFRVLLVWACGRVWCVRAGVRADWSSWHLNVSAQTRTVPNSICGTVRWPYVGLDGVT